eukprot:GHUV01023479.1.p1 GENE.GHUV01023479.1~~GHUV01023479.1.p1  ORF type:complete len:117 (+),score=15.14 GHUV01023479.1:1021-1371(+)
MQCFPASLLVCPSWSITTKKISLHYPADDSIGVTARRIHTMSIGSPRLLSMLYKHGIVSCCLYAEDMPALVLPPLEYPGILHRAADAININQKIMDLYLNTILPGNAVGYSTRAQH